MAGTRKKATSQRKSRDEAEWQVLFPFKDVELQCGEKVVVRQWDIDTGAILTGRVARLIQKLRGEGAEVEIDKLLELAAEECKDIVRITIGWSEDDFHNKLTFEDFLDLLQAVIDTSLVREDGGGALPKIVALAGALGPLVGVRRPSPSPSTSSSPTDTPSET